MTMQKTALLKLMHLVSPALPVGAYAYSQGQEYAVDAGWLKDAAAVQDWIRGVLGHSMARLDMPVLKRIYEAWRSGDKARVIYWDAYIRANRETAELLLEDKQLGSALHRLLISLDGDKQALDGLEQASYVTLFAYAGALWSIPLDELLHGLAWSWVENQVAAATKIVPLGQTQAQQMLSQLIEPIEQAVQVADTIVDDNIGAGLPALAIASSLHERQYSRLFRS